MNNCEFLLKDAWFNKLSNSKLHFDIKGYHTLIVLNHDFKNILLSSSNSHVVDFVDYDIFSLNGKFMYVSYIFYFI